MSVIANTNFEERYIALKKRENRIYPDEEVFQLPDIAKQNPYYKEWRMRKQSMQRLIRWLEKKNKPMKILEIGCGNGWLCNRLSEIKNSDITGLDINSTELEQATRVFKNNLNVKFVLGEIDSQVFANEKFDIILFAASLQYFQSLQDILFSVLEHLNDGGEIHIVDTHFYKKEELTEARKRSIDYFTAIGFPDMADRYFHHYVQELEGYNSKILYQPSSGLSKFFRNNNPFPWICVKRN